MYQDDGARRPAAAYEQRRGGEQCHRLSGLLPEDQRGDRAVHHGHHDIERDGVGCEETQGETEVMQGMQSGRQQLPNPILGRAIAAGRAHNRKLHELGRDAGGEEGQRGGDGQPPSPSEQPAPVHVCAKAG
jgi:hypothetical protein